MVIIPVDPKAHTCQTIVTKFCKISSTRKYKCQNRKQTGHLENNFGDVDVEWWLMDNDRVRVCEYVLASGILVTNDMYDDYE